MLGRFFKTGEFAEICGVKKDTLLHYDHIGILVPERIEENGYRYYSVRQLYTFDLITALKRLGMPLQEIKAYLDQRNPREFLALLQQQQEILMEEQRRLESVNRLLRDTIEDTSHGLEVKPGTLRLEYCEEEYYVAMEAPEYAHYDERQFLLRSRGLLEWAKKNGGLSLRLGDIVTQESLEKNIFVEDYFYCRVPEETDRENVQLKPAGTYAVLYHEGAYETLEGAYEKLIRWVRQQGYPIIGHLYEEDLLHFMSVSDPNGYIMRISVQIQPPQDE